MGIVAAVMLFSEDVRFMPFDRLNNDVLRKIYVQYVRILNETRLDDITSAIADGISAFVASSLSTYSTQGFCHRGTRPHETINGLVRPYGMGRVIILNVEESRCVLRLKRMADYYTLSDWECNDCSDFSYRVLSKTVQKFNALPVQADNRKPSRRRSSVRLETRDKFIEELVMYTTIPEARVARLVDG